MLLVVQAVVLLTVVMMSCANEEEKLELRRKPGYQYSKLISLGYCKAAWKKGEASFVFFASTGRTVQSEKISSLARLLSYRTLPTRVRNLDQLW